MPKHFFLERPIQSVRYLQRVVRKLRGKNPSVKLARSFCLDADCYTVFEHQGVQYIKIMSVVKRERIVIPLKGNTALDGNIRVVLDGDVVYVHKQDPLEEKAHVEGSEAYIDFGYSEVATG